MPHYQVPLAPQAKIRKPIQRLQLMTQPLFHSSCQQMWQFYVISNTLPSECSSLVLCLTVVCFHLWHVSARKVCSVLQWVSVCVCVRPCRHIFPPCAEEKGATPRSCCSSTNLVVTVPFIPPIGHGALWQSHVFAHWERQFLANFNRTVTHKKGRATCTGGGANPAHLFTRLLTLSCLWVCASGLVDVVFGGRGVLSNAECHWLASCCWMWRGVFVGCVLANAVWLN